MKIISSWDDGSKEDIKLAEMLEKYGVKSIFFWPVNLEKSLNCSKIKEFLTLKDCEQIAKKHEIGSHTVTHSYLTRIELPQAEKEIKNSRKFWQDLTKQDVDWFCYPRGWANEDLKQLVKKHGYKYARNTLVGNVSNDHDDPYFIDTSVHVGYNREQYGVLTWQEYFVKMYEKAKAENGTFHFWGHSWELTLNKAWNDLERLLKTL
jgi:peptidoglycan/xylan/chitin deacetylase (PgdA/CDA1 family)